MKPTMTDRLLRREVGRPSTFKSFYGDRSLVENLDIVQELGGHSGCVNTLCWSSSGRLLVSGSDDQYLNVYSHQSLDSTAPISLSTTVSTGHSANIFSVKFMPHSGDKTVVTCAGDAEVRVFDIECNGRSTIPPGPSTSTPRAHLNNIYKGVQYLSYGDTNTRIYRSHADRVKRIVTESSPFLFLTCSEDGEVRQFDLRLPSSAYPSPRGRNNDPNVPPPLISYKRHRLDLNTISCSATQPHYIALGGAHLHCFLHDRRMLGRDRLAEQGNPGNVTPTESMSSVEDESMSAATKCVRRFAPNGKSRMRRTDNGHITACKISDANPNELIASWSGDHIYSFDILRSPDAADAQFHNSDTVGRGSGTKAKETPDRKRKRRQGKASTSSDRVRRSSKTRRSGSAASETGDLALRVHYGNGQSEDIAMRDPVVTVPQAAAENARSSLLNESQKRSLRIAKSVVKIRKLLFSLSDTDVHRGVENQHDHFCHEANFTLALGLAASSIRDMDAICKSWRYPLNPQEGDVAFQQTLRGHRDSSRRFVQAAGTLAKVLGGELKTGATDSNRLLQQFQLIGPAPCEGPSPSQREIFSLDFLKAILLWLDGGPNSVLEGFKRTPGQRKYHSRFPIPDEAGQGGVDDYLIPYLLQMAGSRPIPNIDASRFERDEHRQAFASETGAVIAFSSSIRMPLRDLSRAIMPAEEGATARTIPVAQDKQAALKFWGLKVGRGLLMNAGEGINYRYVDVAFGGLGTTRIDEGRVQDDIDPDEPEDVVDTVSLVVRESTESRDATTITGSADTEINEIEGSASTRSMSRDISTDPDDAGSDTDVVLIEDIHDEIAEHLAEHGENEDDDDGDEDQDEQDDDDAGNSDEDITAEERQFIFRSASNRGKIRELVDQNVPYSSHTRSYAGHCNVRTVKDVNFFGLNDEYVVSGSDCGNLFIWDRQTSAIVSILEADGEIVNVVQGHPYETTLAVSGIDSTIKIFSPDSRAQEDARNGVNISNSSNGFVTHSSLSGGRRRARNSGETRNGEGLESRRRMELKDEIVRENEVNRRSGMREAFITRGMLAQLSARLRARQATAGGNGEGDGEGVPVMLDSENCSVM